MAAIALSKDVKVTVCKPGGVLLGERLEHGVQVVSHFILGSHVLIAIGCEGESSTDWVVNEQQMVAVGPGGFTVVNLTGGIDVVWSKLEEVASLAGATRTALEPQDQWILILLNITTLLVDLPVEHRGPWFADWNQT